MRMERVICLIIGYFIGCIQTAFIVGRLLGKIDIREFGSGNAGTTNVTRVIGAKAGAIVFIADIYNEREDFMWKMFGIKLRTQESQDYWGE